MNKRPYLTGLIRDSLDDALIFRDILDDAIERVPGIAGVRQAEPLDLYLMRLTVQDMVADLAFAMEELTARMPTVNKELPSEVYLAYDRNPALLKMLKEKRRKNSGRLVWGRPCHYCGGYGLTLGGRR